VVLYDYPLKSSFRNGNGLKLLFKRNTEVFDYEDCTSPAFTVHSPHELPGSYDQNEQIDYYYGYDFEILITPEIIKSDRDIKSYKPKIRGCYFEGEKKLRYFKVYSRRNCEFECLANKLLEKLECVPYYVVRNETTEVCDVRKQALLEVELFLAVRNMSHCQCLEECDSIKYNIEVIAHSNDDLSNASYSMYRHYVDTYVSMDFKFKDTLIAPLRRYQAFKFSEFLAQAGGMLGLFAGISVLSVFELFYFITLRFFNDFCKWFRQNRNQILLSKTRSS
jgi:acid-sensing ion channel, other